MDWSKIISKTLEIINLREVVAFSIRRNLILIIKITKTIKTLFIMPSSFQCLYSADKALFLNPHHSFVVCQPFCYFLVNALRTAARPSKPEPRSHAAAGMGTGSTFATRYIMSS